jgi:hypothetical protein
MYVAANYSSYLIESVAATEAKLVLLIELCTQKSAP